jgi:regulator of protease activity HflC (stomatin/prohibitin superfamily)
MTADGTDDVSVAVPATVTGDAAEGASAPVPATVTTPAPTAAAPAAATQAVTEFAATTLPGWPVAWAALAVIIVGAALTAVGGAAVGGGVALIVVAAIVLGGLTPVAPGEARVVQLLGRYTGTIRAQGLQWVSPITKRRKISTRIRNHETGLAKVNDADGNPIEIAAVVVWQVVDTGKALFGVDNYTSFVAIQTETAVRHVAGRYPYDAVGDDKLSLRENADEIMAGLAAEIAERVQPAGVLVLEARLTRLSYAAEIATMMLRRQQASAVVAARYRIVEGAVGMVEAALERLSADGIVDLDDERRAAMVSNMMVVLCSEQATQPIVNTGTLYS